MWGRFGVPWLRRENRQLPAPSQVPPTRGKGLLDRGDWMVVDAIESAVGLVTDFLGIP